MDNLIIQGLWIGDRLSTMERLVISSYIANGHRFHLYAYGEIGNVPAGTIVMNGNAVLPEEKIFSYQIGESNGSLAGFSNYFRYKLLLDRGGWWTDMDMVCLRPYDFDAPYVFSAERECGRDAPNVGVIKVPAGSRLMQYCWNFCKVQDKDKLQWGMIGPDLFEQAVGACSLERYIRAVSDFCSITYDQVATLLEPGCLHLIPDTAYGLHFWNEMWRRQGLDKDESFDRSSIYEMLKEQYLGRENGGSD